jgi:integrase/recombinase XerD
MDELFNEFIREKTYIHNLSPRTIKYYKEIYRFFNQARAFEKLSKRSLQEALIKFRERGVSPGAINTYIRGMNTFLNWLRDEHGYENLSMKKLKGAEPVMRSLTDAEVKLLMSWKPVTECDKRLKMITMTILDTGIRIDEALSLRKDKVDFENLLLTVVGKGNKTRTIPFSLELRKTLYKFVWRHDYELVFCTVQGSKITYCNALRGFTKMTDSLDIKILKGECRWEDSHLTHLHRILFRPPPCSLPL